MGTGYYYLVLSAPESSQVELIPHRFSSEEQTWEPAAASYISLQSTDNLQQDLVMEIIAQVQLTTTSVVCEKRFGRIKIAQLS